jgi:ribosomal peptide maturation radical SAM protein 1
MAFRSKSAERVLDELTFLAKRYETSYVQFVDNILDLRYFKSLIPELANRKHGLRIFYETKSNLKKDQVRLLSDAGIRHIQPGIESFNTQVLKLMRKGVTALQNIQFLKWCEQYGVKAEWNLLYGFPGENAEAYKQILQILQSVTHFPVPTAVAPIRMDRFSPNFEEANSRGFTNLRPMLPYRYIYPFSSEELLRLCYYFDFDYADGTRPDEYTEEIVAFCYTWRKATGGKRRLQHFVLADQAYIKDERFTRRCDRVHLDKIQNSIVIFCDTARTLEQIQSHLASSFPERAFEAKRIQAFLNYLIEQRLMVQEEAQYLSIVPLPENDSDVRSGETEWRLKPEIRARNESLVEVSA